MVATETRASSIGATSPGAMDFASNDSTTQQSTPESGISPDTAAIRRLLDANLDRAREGLRVLEDWSRFALDRTDLVAALKDLRQRLGRLHQTRYKLERDTAGDGGAGMGHPAQLERQEPAQVLAANAGRVQEALRVLEEFGRLEDAALAREAAAIRYRLYDLEVELLRASAGSSPAGGPLQAAGESAAPQAPGSAEGAGSWAQTERTATGSGATGAERRARLQQCRLYLITRPVPQLMQVVEQALQAGVRLVQYRAKEADDRSRLAEAQAIRQLCSRHGALFLVNDRIDLALAVDADGVHLGQDDLPPDLARRLLGPDRLIGRSTHALEQLQQAERDGCDYVGVGPVNATPTKPGRTPVGLDYVRQAAAEARIPWFAIGGIESSSLAPVLEAGARRVAVVRAITDAADPGAATAELLAGLAEAADGVA